MVQEPQFPSFPRFPPGMWVGAFFGVVLLVFFVTWTTRDVQRAKQDVPPGSSWTLSLSTFGEKSVPVALDEPTLEAIWFIVPAPPNLSTTDKAESALTEAREAGRVIMVPDGQVHAKVIETKPCSIDAECIPETKRVRIRILDGENAGKEGWVSSRWLTQEESK